MYRLQIGYCCFGALIGFVSGITDAAITAYLLTALFAFIGGSALFFVNKSEDERKLVGGIMICFALTCALGLSIGIFAKVNRWFDHTVAATANAPGNAPRPAGYLHSAAFKDRLDAIKSKEGRVPCDKLYKDLLEFIENAGGDAAPGRAAAGGG